MQGLINLFENRRTIVVLVLIAFLVRLSVGIYSYQHKAWENFGDDNARKKFALSILSNGFIPETSNYFRTESIFAPVVPLVIAASTFLFGDSWLPVFIINAILGTISCLIFFKISRYYFSSKVSVLVLLWAAFYPNYIRYTGTGGNEPWIVFLFALTFFFAMKAIHAQKLNFNVVLYSLFFVLLVHTDERYLSYSLFFALILLISRNSIRYRLKSVMAFILFTLLFSAPWLIRNYLYYNDVVLISVRTTNITNHFIHHRAELNVFDHTPNTTYLNPAQIDSVQKGLSTRFPGGIPIYKGEIDAIKSGNIPHLFTGPEKIISRFCFLWMPFKLRDNYRVTGYDFNPAWSLKHNLLTGLSYGLLLPFMLMALYYLVRKGRWEEIILFGGVMLFHTIVHVAFIPYTRDRYRHPIDFIIIILGIYGISVCYNYLKKWNLIKNVTKLLKS